MSLKIYSLYILNKAGGLIYQNDITPGLNKLPVNDYLVLAGTLHGVHAIASKISPPNLDLGTLPQMMHSNVNEHLINTGKSQINNLNKTGLKSFETDLFAMFIFQSLTGLKFILICSPISNQGGQNGKVGELNVSKGQTVKVVDSVDLTFKRIYTIYSDYVMKNPFYSIDMPIRCELFDMKIAEFA